VTFLKLLAAAEIGTGAALLLPVVPNKLAGAALTAFSGGLLGLYLRTEALHKPGSVWAHPGRRRGQQGRVDAGYRPVPAGRAVQRWLTGLAQPGAVSWPRPRHRC
jgi:hypothetical protein